MDTEQKEGRSKMFVSKYHFDRLLNRIEKLEDQVRELQDATEVVVPDTRPLCGIQGYTHIKVNSAVLLLLKKMGLKYKKESTEELVNDK